MAGVTTAIMATTVEGNGRGDVIFFFLFFFFLSFLFLFNIFKNIIPKNMIQISKFLEFKSLSILTIE